MPVTDQLVVPVAVPLPPRSFTQVTCVTPTLSLAVPPIASGVAVTAVRRVAGRRGDRHHRRRRVGAAACRSPSATSVLGVARRIARRHRQHVRRRSAARCPLTDQLVVPVAVPLPPRSFTQRHLRHSHVVRRPSRPVVSGVVVALCVGLRVGVVIVTAGAVVSGVAACTSPSASSVPVLPAASRAVTVSTFVAALQHDARSPTSSSSPSPCRCHRDCSPRSPASLPRCRWPCRSSPAASSSRCASAFVGVGDRHDRRRRVRRRW